MIKFDDSCVFESEQEKTETLERLNTCRNADVIININNHNIRLNACSILINDHYFENLKKLLSEFNSLEEIVRVGCKMLHEEDPDNEQLFDIFLSGTINCMMDDLKMILENNQDNCNKRYRDLIIDYEKNQTKKYNY